MRRLLFASALFFLFPSLGRASASFPAVVQSEINPAQGQACTLCHSTNSGGMGTVIQPVGISLQARGAVLVDEDKLRTALRALETEAVDSDQDGTSDVAELRAGKDPNRAEGGGGGGGLEDPTYGCGVGSAGVSGLSLGVMIVWMAIQWRRRSGA